VNTVLLILYEQYVRTIVYVVFVRIKLHGLYCKYAAKSSCDHSADSGRPGRQLLIRRQGEPDGDAGLAFDGMAIDEVGFVSPLLYCFDGGFRQIRMP
jgi:hypothetical protein